MHIRSLFSRCYGVYAGHADKLGQTKSDIMSSHYIRRAPETSGDIIRNNTRPWHGVTRTVSTFGRARVFVVRPLYRCRCRPGLLSKRRRKKQTNEKLCRNDKSHDEIVVTAGRIGQSSRRHVCSLANVT